MPLGVPLGPLGVPWGPLGIIWGLMDNPKGKFIYFLIAQHLKLTMLHTDLFICVHILVFPSRLREGGELF